MRFLDLFMLVLIRNFNEIVESLKLFHRKFVDENFYNTDNQNLAKF